MWSNPDISDALYLSIGRHLGGALILNGEISVGRTGRSGTFEHMTLVPNGKRCYCGQNGCVECYCSIQACTAFPEKDCFLIQGGQRKEAVTIGVALPFIKEFLAKI